MFLRTAVFLRTRSTAPSKPAGAALGLEAYAWAAQPIATRISINPKPPLVTRTADEPHHRDVEGIAKRRHECGPENEEAEQVALLGLSVRPSGGD